VFIVSCNLSVIMQLNCSMMNNEWALLFNPEQELRSLDSKNLALKATVRVAVTVRVRVTVRVSDSDSDSE